MSEPTAQLTAEIKALGVLIQDTVNTQNAEIKKFGETSLTSGKTLGELEKKYDAVLADLENEKKLSREFEAKMQKAGFGAAIQIESIGAQFVKSEAFKNYANTGNRAKLEVKTLTTTNTNNPQLVRPDRQEGIIMPAQRMPTIRDLLSQGRTDKNAVEFVQETLFFQVAAEVATATIATATTMILTVIDGLFVGQVCTFGAGAASTENRTISAINVATRTITVSVAFTNAHAVNELVGSSQLQGTPEEIIKPEGVWRNTLLTIPVRTVAYLLRIAKQTLDDAAQLESIITARMALGLQIAENWQLLNGDGIGQNLAGLMSQARAYNRTTGGDTKLDCLRRAFTQARLSEYVADGLLLNPIDWELIELLKGTDSRYVWVNVNVGGEARLWRMRVIDTTAIPVGKFLVGAFQQGAQLFDRMDATMELFEQDRDNVPRNMVTIRAEERLALTVIRPEAFVQGNLP
jgi:hypothetical protein